LKDVTADHPILDEDKYYAILLMDGDRMGRLVNGETLASRWRTVLHPDLVSRLERTDFAAKYRRFWKERLESRRLLAPQTHAAISEALGDFSLYTVPAVIGECHGRLIYAGGDDVCAVMPLSTVMDAARRIALCYSMGFVFIQEKAGRVPEEVSRHWTPAPGRLAVHLGQGDDISISAGILICHHKKPLSAAMRRAHEVLNLAKNMGGRNALALELQKRSGGARRFIVGWDETPIKELFPAASMDGMNGNRLLDHFFAAAKALSTTQGRRLSSSLVYRLEEFRPGLEAIVGERPGDLVKFLIKHVSRSGVNSASEVNENVARSMAALLTRRIHGDGLTVDTDGLLIARFLGASLSRSAENAGGSK
ncbi:MAG: type III-B CRISPR-associated protein Cas10/Cmr2, partial [Pseudomonadota bacterium]